MYKQLDVRGREYIDCRDLIRRAARKITSARPLAKGKPWHCGYEYVPLRAAPSVVSLPARSCLGRYGLWAMTVKKRLWQANFKQTTQEGCTRVHRRNGVAAHDKTLRITTTTGLLYSRQQYNKRLLANSKKINEGVTTCGVVAVVLISKLSKPTRFFR